MPIAVKQKILECCRCEWSQIHKTYVCDCACFLSLLSLWLDP